MEELKSIPTGKIERAGKFLETGAKVGGNYLKYYAKKITKQANARIELDQSNANVIYKGLSELKGSALKIAQMMSLDSTFLPTAYSSKFKLAQNNSAPLSYPLVVKTFKSEFGKTPHELFSHFNTKASNAASIGQVHKASLNDIELAVKVQYPGIAKSIHSDLAFIKPIAQKLFNIPKKDLAFFLEEVEGKLIEETDYSLELENSMFLSEQCKILPNMLFPRYYPALSSKKIITMSWVNGTHLTEWLKQNPTQQERNEIAQILWDFYHFQLHKLRMVHADPHPGNFLITNDLKLGILDFGCTKKITQSFYEDYFRLTSLIHENDKNKLTNLFFKLEFLHKEDTTEELNHFYSLFKNLSKLLAEPFRNKHFNFGDKAYFKEITSLGEKMSQDSFIRNSSKVRGSRESIYINRTYYGLYSILHELNAEVYTNTYLPILNYEI